MPCLLKVVSIKALPRTYIVRAACRNAQATEFCIGSEKAALGAKREN